MKGGSGLPNLREPVRGGKGPWIPLTNIPVLAPSEEHGYARVREGLLQQWKKIYEDQALKDVEITLCDGEKVMADSLILRQSSAVFNAMLTHNMLERQTMSLHLDDCPSAGFRFFLRLLYTGQMDPSEWPSEDLEQHELQPEPVPHPSPHPPPLPEHDATPQGPPLTLTSPNSEDSALDRPQSIPGTLFVEAQGVFGAPPVAVGDVAGPKASFVTRSPTVPPAAPKKPQPPLDILLTAAALSKKYQVEWLLSVLVDAVKKRISEDTFECILTAAMRMDLSPVRLCALEFAKGNTNLRNRYEAGDFHPDIIFEMQAVFPVRAQCSNDISI